MMAASPVTLDELAKEVGIPKSSLGKRCTDDHLSGVSIFLDWRATAPQLGLDEAETEAIAEEGRTEAERRLKTLRRWKAKYGFKATYRRLVKALLSVGRADHAEDVCRMFAGHCQQGSRDAESSSSSVESSDSATTTLENTSEETSEDAELVLSATLECDLPGSVPGSRRKRTRSREALKYQIPKKRAKLSYQIKELDQHFRSLACRAARRLESVDLFELKVHITQLPVSMKQHHMKFLSGNMSAINDANSIVEIFEILGRYWNFLNYGLLQHLIDTFGDKKLKRDMKKYLKQLKEFRSHTTVGKFIQKWAGELPPYYSDLTMEMTEEWKERTLQELEHFQRKFAHHCAIKTYLRPPLQKGNSGSLILSWGLHCSFPISELVLLCQSAATHYFLKRHGVLRIVFKMRCVFDDESVQTTRKQLEMRQGASEEELLESQTTRKQLEMRQGASEEELLESQTRVKQLEEKLVESKRQMTEVQQNLQQERQELTAALQQKESQLQRERNDRESIEYHYKKYHQQRVKEFEEQLQTKEERTRELAEQLQSMSKEKEERIRELAEQLQSMSKEKEERIRELAEQLQSMSKEKDERIRELAEQLQHMAKEKEELFIALLSSFALEPPKQVRRYQYELAEPGIKGENYIICAPTGTGKL